MSTVTNAVTTCPDLQTTLEENFLVCPYGIDPITLLPFLYSPENRSGIDFRVSPVPGKTRELLAVYGQLISDSEAVTISDCEGNCTATTARGDLSTTYTMDCDGFLMEEIYEPADWRLSCTSGFAKVSSTILKLVAALDNKISKSVVSEVAGLMGAWASEVDGLTGDVLVVNTKLAGTETPNPSAWSDIDLALLQTGYCADAFMAGGADLYKYNRLMEAGCCSTSGLNLADMFALYGKAVTWDAHIQAAVGQTITWSIMRGAIQLLTLNMNGGTELDLPYLNVGPGAGSEFAGIIVSPYTGLPYDLTVRYDCRKIHIIVEGRVKAVGLPLDMFPASHRMEGVTYANVIQVTNT